MKLKTSFKLLFGLLTVLCGALAGLAIIFNPVITLLFVAIWLLAVYYIP